MEFLFGEGQYGVRILVAVFLVLALIGVLAWFVRVFRSERTGAASRRGRQPPRLAVIDAAAVDERRRLVLIRRDNVEHLLMIGGRADIVVEPNIVRAAALARAPALAEHQATQLEAAPTVFTPPGPQTRAGVSAHRGRSQFRRGCSTARRGSAAAPQPGEVRRIRLATGSGRRTRAHARRRDISPTVAGRRHLPGGQAGETPVAL